MGNPFPEIPRGRKNGIPDKPVTVVYTYSKKYISIKKFYA
jgi:hypothetical protein